MTFKAFLKRCLELVDEHGENILDLEIETTVYESVTEIDGIDIVTDKNEKPFLVKVW
jgi:hypothetical protein